MALSGNLNTSTWYGQEQNAFLRLSWTATQTIEESASVISWELISVVNEKWVSGGFFNVEIDGEISCITAL